MQICFRLIDGFLGRHFAFKQIGLAIVLLLGVPNTLLQFGNVPLRSFDLPGVNSAQQLAAFGLCDQQFFLSHGNGCLFIVITQDRQNIPSLDRLTDFCLTGFKDPVNLEGKLADFRKSAPRSRWRE